MEGRLRGLISDAGFRDVRILVDIRTVRFPSAEEFLRREAASSPLAGPLSALSGEVRGALIRDLTQSLRFYTDDGGILSPTAAYMAVAGR
jgi:hypothetical protein